MKLRMLGIVLVLALVPMAAEAQKDVPGEGRPSPITRVTQAQIEKVIPVLQAEAGATNAFWWDQRAARGMTKQEYAAVKNALIAARLDAADAARLNSLPFDDGSRAARQANVAVFRANAARLSTVLTKVHADGCGPACSAVSTAPAKSR